MSDPVARGDGKTAELLPCPFCGVHGNPCDIGYTLPHKRGCWFWRMLADGQQWLHPNEFGKWNKRAEEKPGERVR